MVLSNKKLKLKLRAELAQQQNHIDEVPSSSNSLKTLLDAATPTPRLSKRDKRRKLRSSEHPPNEANKETETEGSANKKKKKRKRKVEDDDVANGVPDSTPQNNSNKKKKKKKKKLKKDKKKPKTAEENDSNGAAEVQKATELTKTNTTTRLY